MSTLYIVQDETWPGKGHSHGCWLQVEAWSPFTGNVVSCNGWVFIESCYVELNK